ALERARASAAFAVSKLWIFNPKFLSKARLMHSCRVSSAVCAVAGRAAGRTRAQASARRDRNGDEMRDGMDEQLLRVGSVSDENTRAGKKLRYFRPGVIIRWRDAGRGRWL